LRQLFISPKPESGRRAARRWRPVPSAAATTTPSGRGPHRDARRTESVHIVYLFMTHNTRRPELRSLGASSPAHGEVGHPSHPSSLSPSKRAHVVISCCTSTMNSIFTKFSTELTRALKAVNVTDQGKARAAVCIHLLRRVAYNARTCGGIQVILSGYPVHGFPFISCLVIR
jgi:hypothetical protein